MTRVQVRIAAVLVLAILAGSWLHARSRRLGVERRAGTVASALAGRDVTVTCPGPIERRVYTEILDGSVRFDANARPAREARLTKGPCDGLRRALDDGPSLTLDCLPAACGDDDREVANALAVLAHESAHLAGVTDEATAECHAIRDVPWVATRFGLPAEAGRRIAEWEATVRMATLPERYRSGCGGHAN